jgi:hypothetical protein
MEDQQIVEQVATEVPTGAARKQWLEQGSHIEPDAPPPDKKAEAESKTPDGEQEQKAQETPPAEKKAEAKTDDKTPEPRVSRSERRIIELLSEVKELKARLATPAKVEEKTAPSETREAAKAEQTEKKPELKDFADVGEYVEALTAFNTKAAIKEYESKRATADAEAAAKKANEAIQTEYLGKVAKAKERHEDFEAVAFAPDLPIKAGSVVDAWILDSENGMELLYHLGKNPAELDRINALKTPFAQARELTKLEVSLLEKKSAAPAGPKKISEAPPPASRVEGEKTSIGDESRQAVIDGDTRAYIAAENAKDASRKR